MGKFYVVDAGDARFEKASLLTNDGFPVTDEEARIMARITRHFVAAQRSLPDGYPEFDAFAPAAMNPWPRKIRSDFTDKFAEFAEWAESSGGFRIF